MSKPHKPNKKFDELMKIATDDKYGMMLAPMPAQTALDILVSYLLGEDWYLAASMSEEQANTEAVLEILYRHSKQYRKDLRRYLKEMEEKKNE